MKYLKFDEPFTRLFNQGMLHGEDGFVMSKSRGNVVLPEEVSEKYGIDTARFFLVSIASPNKDLKWSDAGIEGSSRFMKRVLHYFDSLKLGKSSKKVESKLNTAIKGVTEDLDNFKYNMAVIKVRELFDALEEEVSKDTIEKFLKLLHPFCPHITEELWEKIGNKPFISIEKWPKYDEKKIDLKAEALEEVLHDVVADINAVNIKQPKKIKLIVASGWKYEFTRQMRKQFGKTFNTGEIIKGLMKDEKLKKHGAVIAKIVPKIVKDTSKLPKTDLDQKTELKNFESNKDFFKKEFKAGIEVIKEDDSKEAKAASAMPGKPAILLS
jgi:leucyl-tRNA synthetase